uniref:Ubiquitin-like domain-containing protein n=1 Tax=Tetranychus urticae TaxID=32264 RepID=T1JTA8_TETUR
MEDVVIYRHPSEGLNDLKHHLENKVSIPAKSALLLWNKQQIHDSAEVNCTPDNPVLLLNSDTRKNRRFALRLRMPIPEQLKNMFFIIKLPTLYQCILYKSLIDSNVNFRLLTEKQQTRSHIYPYSPLLDLDDSVSNNFQSMIPAETLFKSTTEYSTTLMPKMTCMQKNI